MWAREGKRFVSCLVFSAFFTDYTYLELERVLEATYILSMVMEEVVYMAQWSGRDGGQIG